MRRREVIALLGSAAAVWPLAAPAQQPNRMRLIGMLMGFAESDPTAQSTVAAFRNALPKLGWTEGSNVRIELRWGGYDADRVKTLARELVDLRPDAILGQTTPVIGALVPAIYFSAYCAQSGGLIAYGTDYAEQSRQAAGYVDRILKGTKPADLPVQAPTKFELLINLKTAKTLGLQVPDKLLALADEVIE
jgi:ABC-type uncharacterized transport system substrate-binding protein